MKEKNLTEEQKKSLEWLNHCEEYLAESVLSHELGYNLIKSESPDWKTTDEKTGIECTTAYPAIFNQNEGEYTASVWAEFEGDMDKKEKHLKKSARSGNGFVYTMDRYSKIGTFGGDIASRDCSLIDTAIHKKKNTAKKYSDFDNLYLFIEIIGGIEFDKSPKFIKLISDAVNDSEMPFNGIFVLTQMWDFYYKIGDSELKSMKLDHDYYNDIMISEAYKHHRILGHIPQKGDR